MRPKFDFFGIRYSEILNEDQSVRSVELEVPCAFCGDTCFESWQDKAVYNCRGDEIDPTAARMCHDCRGGLRVWPFLFDSVPNPFAGSKRMPTWRCDDTHIAGVGRLPPRNQQHLKTRFVGTWQHLFYNPLSHEIFNPNAVTSLLMTCISEKPLFYMRGPSPDNSYVLIVKDGPKRWLMLGGLMK